MTDREKAIVMAYTGYAMLTGDKLGLYYQYIQEIVGRPVMTHELAEKPMQETIHTLSKPDFVELCRTNDEPRVLDFDEVVGGDECWFENVNGVSGYGCFYACIRTGEVQMFRCSYHNPTYIAANEYLKTWRCWTSRPADEQRKAVKWDD